MAWTSGGPSMSFEQYARQVYGWAYRVLGRHHDALDVVQDVFLRWDEQCAVSLPAQPRGWLRRVTFNRAIDMCRRRIADTDAISRRPPADTVVTDAPPPLDCAELRAD